MKLFNVKKSKFTEMKSGMIMIRLLVLLTISTGGCEMSTESASDTS